MEETPIQRLKEYFAKRDDVLMAFVFGSRSKDTARAVSDWDIGVYFQSDEWLEMESSKEYPGEHEIWGDLERMLKSEVDLLVLNRARPSLVFSVLNTGYPLAVKDERLYLELLSRTHYEAVDYWNFVQEFWEIHQKAASLTTEAKTILQEHLAFLESEFSDFEKFKQVSWEEYREDRDKCRSMERWIENLVMSSIDIAKIVLASRKRTIPQTYRETLREFGLLYLEEAFAGTFAETVELRNIVAHEYLDIRWDRIRKFIDQAGAIYPVFMAKVKELIEKENNLS